jgi:Flp pilus assembly protein TadB
MNAELMMVMTAGGLIGFGVAMGVIWFTPAVPDLADTLKRLSDSPAYQRGATVGAAAGRERLGVWAMRTLPAGLWIRTPSRELALLRIPLARFYGDKLVFAALGFVIPILLAGFLSLLGLPLPYPVPVLGCLALAAVMFFIPNYNAIDDAKKARLEFTRALGAYIELVALERTNGAGVRQAMESAAEVGDSWVFTRLSEELTRSRWSGLPPWDALHTLATELGLPDLDDFADIMRLSGEEGAATYATLRARSAAMRTAMLNDELTEANAIGERMSIPGSLLGVIFMAILLAPSLLRMIPG